VGGFADATAVNNGDGTVTVHGTERGRRSLLLLPPVPGPARLYRAWKIHQSDIHMAEIN
jgi:hypothetical protein